MHCQSLSERLCTHDTANHSDLTTLQPQSSVITRHRCARPTSVIITCQGFIGWTQSYVTVDTVYIILVIAIIISSSPLYPFLPVAELRYKICTFCICIWYWYFSRAAVSGISVLVVPLDLFCCTCYFVVFLSQEIDNDDNEEEAQRLRRQLALR